MSDKKKYLVVASHPDDEILGCGGMMARQIDEGHEVHVLILGEGATSRHGAGADEVSKLKEMSRRAAGVLGVDSVTHCGFPDNKFDTVPLLEVVNWVEAKVRALQPGFVFTQHGGDLNIDHSITFRATMTAVRPMKNSSVRSLYSYEVPSSTEWAFNQYHPGFAPDSFVDISNFLEKKIQAISCYDEMRPFPHPRSSKAITAYARVRGSSVGMEAAEAFQTVFNLSI